LATGAAIALFGLMLVIALSFKEIAVDPSKFAFAWMFVIGGLSAALSTAITVPRWHRTRADQMDGIIERVVGMIQSQPVATESRKSVVDAPRQAENPILKLGEELDEASDAASRRSRDRT
jgi:hypothetical protein